MTRVLLLAAAVAACVLTAVLHSPPLRAQAPAPPAFEVASVKPNKSGDGRVMIGLQPGGRITATNVTLRVLLRQAYDIQDFQIAGGPDWLARDRFDIVAKAPEGEVSPDQMRGMMRALLVERFKLATHNETRDLPIYALVKARPDGRLGPAISPAATDCTAMRARRGGGPPPPPPPPGPLPPGQRIDCGLMMGIGRLNSGGMPIAEVARALAPQVGRVVVDKTGLTGGYDFELIYAPEQAALAGGPPLLNGGPAPAVDPNAPNLFTALQEQLGLKLDSQRGPVDVVVIDSVEQPVAD